MLKKTLKMVWKDVDLMFSFRFLLHNLQTCEACLCNEKGIPLWRHQCETIVLPEEGLGHCWGFGGLWSRRLRCAFVVGNSKKFRLTRRQFCSLREAEVGSSYCVGHLHERCKASPG